MLRDQHWLTGLKLWLTWIDYCVHCSAAGSHSNSSVTESNAPLIASLRREKQLVLKLANKVQKLQGVSSAQL